MLVSSKVGTSSNIRIISSFGKYLKSTPDTLVVLQSSRATMPLKRDYKLPTLSQSTSRLYSTQSSTSTISIEATPKVCLSDINSSIKVTGLQPNQDVTLKMEVTDENNILYCSYANYTSSSEGVIDVSHDPSLGGSYTGVFPEGLLSSISPGPGIKTHARIIKQDVFTPFEYIVTVHDGKASSIEELTTSLSRTTIKRYFSSPGVKRIPVREGKLRGTLFLPPGEGPHPSVVDLWGGMGGLVEFRAAMCAARGIASFALAYYAHDDLPSGPENINSRYISDGVDYLLSRPEVIPDRCGIIGHCLGNLFGMAASLFHEKIKAVATISPVFFGYGTNITYDGELLMKMMEPHFHTLDFVDNKFSYLNEKLYKSKYMHSESEYLFPIERIRDDVHYLFAAGTDDPYYPNFSNNAVKERANKHGKYNIEIVEYEGAGHILEVPYGPHIHFSYQPYYPYREGGTKDLITGSKGVFMLWNGNPRSNCNAQVDWWQRSKNFILKHVRDESSWYQNYLQSNKSK